MKRIRILGLCVVAAFAFSALMAAGSAQAGTYGQCVSVKKGPFKDANCTEAVAKKGKFAFVPFGCVAQKKGEYTDAACTIKSKKAKKGKFEKRTLKFTDTGGAAELKSAAGSITCKASTSVGEITGPKSDTDTVTFTGCEALGGGCKGLADTVEGTITTALLETTLVDFGEKGPGGKGEPAKGEVWEDFKNTKGAGAPYLAAFVCTKAGFGRAKGNVSGVKTGIINKMGTTSENALGAGKAEQNLLSDLGCSSPTFETCAAKEVASTQTNTSVDTYPSPGVEIKA
jgi:hypothetical protein